MAGNCRGCHEAAAACVTPPNALEDNSGCTEYSMWVCLIASVGTYKASAACLTSLPCLNRRLC